MDDDSAIEELRLNAKWGSNDKDREKCATLLDEFGDRSVHLVEQRILKEEIFIRIGRQTEFGKYSKCRALRGGLTR
jgi:hypothetical protein